jgi:hypothetical protein
MSSGGRSTLTKTNRTWLPAYPRFLASSFFRFSAAVHGQTVPLLSTFRTATTALQWQKGLGDRNQVSPFLLGSIGNDLLVIEHAIRQLCMMTYSEAVKWNRIEERQTNFNKVLACLCRHSEPIWTLQINIAGLPMQLTDLSSAFGRVPAIYSF